MASPSTPSVTRTEYGTLRDGTAVDRYSLAAGHVQVEIITYGATIMSLRTPDQRGRLDDIVLGVNSLDAYVAQRAYLGAIVGRVANRIAHARFTLDGKVHQLATNEGTQHLHGGVRGFDKVVWKATSFATPNTAGVVFSHTSADGDEGYPGRLDVSVTYTLADTDELTIAYEATTDRPTVLNLTQHTYFNLGGTQAPDVLDHAVTIDADHFIPLSGSKIPTGEIAPVTSTPFDFRAPTRIGAGIDADHPQVRDAGGYDHTFVLRGAGDGALIRAVHVLEPVSGRTLDVHTTEPGVQFYSGNALDGSIRGTAGRVYARRSGFCVETQHYPDSPNQPGFPSVVLRPGEQFRSRTVFTFGTDG